MSVPLVPPEVVDRIRAMSERQLSAEEFEAYLEGTRSADERRDMQEQIAWFLRRYPDPVDRLRWARKTYEAWMKTAPPGSR